VADIIRYYKNAYAIGKSILDTYHQWQSHLLINKHDNDRDIEVILLENPKNMAVKVLKDALKNC